MHKVKPALFLAVSLLTACESVDDHTQLVGQLESDRIELTAEFSEAITERFVVEGQPVQAGQLLIQQRTDRAEARIREAQAALAQNQARVAELTRGPRQEKIVAGQANLDGAQKELTFRELELTRAQSLLDRKLAPEERRDAARSAVDSARANVDLRKAQLEELLTGTTVEELDQARAAVARAEAQIEQLHIDLQRLATEAPLDGIVDSLLFEAGERPPQGQPMAIMLAAKQPYARVYVPEELRVQVTPGMAALVYVDGMQEPVPGRVRWVASEAAFTPYFALTEHDRRRLTFAAKIDLDYRGDRLPDGVPVEVRLPVAGSN